MLTTCVFQGDKLILFRALKKVRHQSIFIYLLENNQSIKWSSEAIAITKRRQEIAKMTDDSGALLRKYQEMEHSGKKFKRRDVKREAIYENEKVVAYLMQDKGNAQVYVLEQEAFNLKSIKHLPLLTTLTIYSKANLYLEEAFEIEGELIFYCSQGVSFKSGGYLRCQRLEILNKLLSIEGHLSVDQAKIDTRYFFLKENACLDIANLAQINVNEAHFEGGKIKAPALEVTTRRQDLILEAVHLEVSQLNLSSHKDVKIKAQVLVDALVIYAGETVHFEKPCNTKANTLLVNATNSLMEGTLETKTLALHVDFESKLAPGSQVFASTFTASGQSLITQGFLAYDQFLCFTDNSLLGGEMKPLTPNLEKSQFNVY